MFFSLISQQGSFLLLKKTAVLPRWSKGGEKTRTKRRTKHSIIGERVKEFYWRLARARARAYTYIHTELMLVCFSPRIVRIVRYVWQLSGRKLVLLLIFLIRETWSWTTQSNFTVILFIYLFIFSNVRGNFP